VDQKTAQGSGLINTNNGAVYMGVDFSNVASSSGRQSVRVTSKKSYTHGLIILDLAHMPGNACGTWPAFWTVGPNWPSSGEIDIIEGVNSQIGNSHALHTNAGCSIAQNGLFSGHVSTPNCDVNAAGQPGNAGCAILNSNSNSFGDGFNQAGGGVYATEWTSDHISIWYFPRSAIPSDMSSNSPDPENWGSPMASWSSSSCDIDEAFSSNQIVFDTTFCGDWAGNVWSQDPVCGSKAPTCQSYVQNNPSAFKESFWSVNSLKVFQSNGQQGGQPSGPPQPPFSSIVPTASVPFPGGASSVWPAAETATASGWGGNGWHTRTFGTAGAFVTASSANATASGPGASVQTMTVSLLASDNAPSEISEPSAAAPSTTMTAAGGNTSDSSGTETTSGDNTFHHWGHGGRFHKVSPPPP
jgi:hypothetical protein